MGNKYSKKHSWEMKKREREVLMQELLFAPYESAKMLYRALGAIEEYLKSQQTADYLSESRQYKNESINGVINELIQKDFPIENQFHMTGGDGS